MTNVRRKSRKIDEYRRKRSADRTPEPFEAGAARPGLFVVQKHAARRMHYDLRLEMGGALKSWAVPKGPSLDPKTKRLAVEVEEHPLEYADFEGIIPAGNYGAGAVIVWDRGRWVAIEDPVAGLASGKLLFDLYGYKLRGRFTLVRTRRAENEWLLIKKPDAESSADRALPESSIRTGLTVEELRDGVDPVARIAGKLPRRNLPRREVDVGAVDLMLARTAERPFSGHDWVFELKYDGYRLLAQRDPSGCRLRFRRGGDASDVFPEIAAAVLALPYPSLILDGEVVVLDDEGRPSFQRLQQRARPGRAVAAHRAALELPATLFAFDLLAFDGRDLRGLPLLERKAILREVLPPCGPLRYSDHIESEGVAMFEQVRKMGLEGIVAKRADSRYVGGRSDAWRKIRVDRVDDFAVVGTSPPKGSRSGFSSLHLAVYEGAGFAYAGRVGSGFTAAQLDEISEALGKRRRKRPVCTGVPPAEARSGTWVEPELVCEVRYKEWTDEGYLRQPVFLRMRDDKPATECIRPGAPPSPPPEPRGPRRPAGPRRTISFTNRDKVFWPEEGYTKGDLIDYYRVVAPRLLPYLVDRPVVLTRYPDGIDGKSFFQKDAPGFVPDWVRTETMWSEHARREIHYFIVEDEETLLYLANLATIPLHLWSSRIGSLQHPDWCILDLDPKDAPFKNVIRVARAIHELCDEIGLPSFVKTSGSTGLHVLLPLKGQCTYDQSRTLGQLLARIVSADLRDIATVARSMSARGGRVYIDYVQNGHGRLLVSPYSVRPRPGATVSTPLRWSEVRTGLDPAKFTIRTAPRRFARSKGDPLRAVLDEAPDLPAVLERLASRL